MTAPPVIARPQPDDVSPEQTTTGWAARLRRLPGWMSGRVGVRWPTPSFLLLVVLPTVLLGALGWHRRWISDDGLIFVRPVRQILAGHGPVFTVGERAEAATSALWQWLLVLAAEVTRIDVVPLAIYGGLVLTVVGCALALAATRRLHEGFGTRVPAGVLVLLALPPMWDYATSGLETGLSFAWVGGCWYLLVALRRGAGTGTLLTFAVVSGLGPLVRPELALFSAILLVAGWLVARPGRRSTLLGVPAAALLPAGYEIFRMGYYGILTPLPGLTKEAGASDWSRGALYLWDFVGPYWLWLVVPVLAVPFVLRFRAVGERAAPDGDASGPTRADRVVLLAPVLGGLLLACYAVRVGGDWMHARMLLLPATLLLLPVLIVPMPAGLARIRRLRPPEARVPVGSWVGGTALLVTAGWLLVSLTPLRSPYDNQRRFFQDVRSDAVRLTGSQHPTTAGLWAHAFRDQDQKISWTLRSGSPVLLAFGVDAQLHPVSFDPGRQRSPRPVTLVAARLGTTGASTPLDLTIIDQLSLASPLGAHLQLHRGVWPGHEKLLSNAWILADAAAPDATIPNQIAFGLAPGDPAAARRALTCGELAELQDSVRAPLTASRFWHNLVGAPRRTALRIPRDPSAAEREFCH